jgi:RNA-binding protein
MRELGESQRKYLRRLGHDLKPVVLMGARGLTDAVLAEIDKALTDHELVKVKVVADDRAQKQAYMQRICESTDAVLIQAIGHIALLYRPNPEKKKGRIALP